MCRRMQPTGQVPKVTQDPPPAVDLVILQSRIIRQKGSCLRPAAALGHLTQAHSSNLGTRDSTVLPLLAHCVCQWSLTAQLRRWRSMRARNLAQVTKSHHLFLVPRALSALAERHCSGKDYGDSELGVFKVTAGQPKPRNWQPCTPSLCESTTGWQLS